MRNALLALTVLLALRSHAQCPAETTLFFGNRMFNSKASAESSLNSLKTRVAETENWKRQRSHIAYNYDENAAFQLLEVYEQKMGDFDRRFWRWMWDWTAAPSWFQDRVKTLQSQHDLEGMQGYALGEHISRYEHEMDLDRSIVVVAHSQGNFYANNASLVLQNDFYSASSDFRIISVATPASFVNDNGPYFNLKSDGVIRWIPGALPYNAVNEMPKPGLFDHRFVDHYLNGQPTGSKIIDTIQLTLKSLAIDAKKADGYNVDCWRWFESLNLPTAESQECVMKCSAAKSDLSNFSCSALCDSYCGCWRRRPQAAKAPTQ